MIVLRDVALRRGAKLLFDHANLIVNRGYRVGLTGANGSGKSSLFALLLGELHADAGDVEIQAGFVVTRIRQDDMATVVWLLGLIWLMIVALWIVDMPTRPNECYQCGVTEKLTRTLFSLPTPSGLIDDDGPFLGTWPAAALVGYSIGAALALRRKKVED